MFKRYIISLFLTLVISYQALAGWVITEQNAGKYGRKTFQTTFIQGNHIRVDATTLVSIFHLKEKNIVLLFPQDKAYWEGSPEQLQQQFRNMMAQQVQLMMSQAPASQRDTLQKIYQGLTSVQPVKKDSIHRHKINIENTGLTTTLLGYNTQVYDLKMDSVLLEKIWVTQQVQPYAGLPMEEILKLTNAVNPFSGSGSIPLSPEYIDLLQNGVVLKRVHYGSGNSPNVSLVTEVKKAKITETIFEIPANYQLMTIEQVMQLDLGRNILDPKLPGREKRLNLTPPPPVKENNQRPPFPK